MKLEFVELQKSEYIYYIGKYKELPPISMLFLCINCGAEKTTHDHKRHVCDECNKSLSMEYIDKLWRRAVKEHSKL